MQGPIRWRWYFPWVPLALATAVLALVTVSVVGHFATRPEPSPMVGPPVGLKPATEVPTVSAYQTGDKLLVAVHVPSNLVPAPVVLELVDADGKVVGQGEQLAVVGGNRFEVAMPKAEPAKVTVRWKVGGTRTEASLASLMLARPHETTVTVGRELFAGSRAALRCGVRGVRSVTELVAHPDALVEVRLLRAGVAPLLLYQGRTNADGVVDAQIQVPQLATGTYKLEVHTRSPMGEDRLTQDVTVKSAAKVLLITDKPLYQPGQTIHLRALCLSAFDLKPAAALPVVFEVADGKGNKVFKKSLATSDFGVAAVDFTLADEVNQGDYRIRAVLGDTTTEKVVSVRPYVLPKFKGVIELDKKYYQPGETVKATLQADYFFQKPVAHGKVKLEVSTFDVQFTPFSKLKLTTDDHGTVKFEVKLPDQLVGQPLNQGNAVVRFEARITDGADHTETVSRTVPVSSRPIQVSLLPEGGRLIPGLENRVFVAAIYPDGTPAVADVVVWQGNHVPEQGWFRDRGNQPLGKVKTAANGLAEVRITPQADGFRPGEWKERKVEMLGGRVVATMAPTNLFDVCAVVRDAAGNAATMPIVLTSEPLGDNLLLRTDKAIYRGGDKLRADVLTSAGGRTVYFDVVRSGQTLLTRWLDVENGRASTTVDLEPGLAGTLEIHAYQVLRSGEIIRDSRVVYVQAADDLRVAVQADKGQYRPGEEGKVRFTVTDAAGKPTQAALGVVVVDEAVYALQEMQPGLEKVYFTLQEELLRPQASIPFQPSERLDVLALQPQLNLEKQQVAEALLTAVRPKPPAHWEVNPAEERRIADDTLQQQVGNALWHYASQKPFLAEDGVSFRPGLLGNVKTMFGWNDQNFKDALGQPVTLEGLERRNPAFTATNLARHVTWYHLQIDEQLLQQVCQQHQGAWLRDGVWTLPNDALSLALKGQQAAWGQDGWGRPILLVKRAQPRQPRQNNWSDFYDLVSSGPDGKPGTADDVRALSPEQWPLIGAWWLTDAERQHGLAVWNNPRRGRQFGQGGFQERGGWNRGLDERDGVALKAMQAPGALPGQGGIGGGGGPFAPGAPRAAMPEAKEDRAKGAAEPVLANQAAAAAAPPVKVREYFPETLLWHPTLLTDDKGQAELTIPLADSITTWRMTASASSRTGSLGGVTIPLKVFQDFFLDIDLPRTLTQGDEVSFPVAVYNYLDRAQKVTLDLSPDDAYELVDGQGYHREVEVKAHDVTNVKFRIRATRLGRLPLKVEARGSDAVLRSVDVVPNGQLVEKAETERFAGKEGAVVTTRHTFPVPANAVPGAGKLYVKVYPGVFSQVMEGADGILRMPGGCFEQTSSSAYPNILAVAYLRKTNQANPAVMMKAEAVLQAGYQRLLTFERPGGGFDWWGRGEPLIWLSAYGLNEFNDMSRVMDIDRGVITRTQQWLIKQQEPDGTWSRIGATHGESIERMGDSRLLLTSYVTWALLESGYRGPQLKKSLDFIRTRAKEEKNAYILALAANALAADDAQDDDTHAILVRLLQRLNEQKTAMPEWKAARFPVAGGQSLSYARGDGLTVETTALAVLALHRNGQFNTSVSECLTFLIKSRDPHGTWGSTQATILALKALTTCSSAPPQKGTADVVVLVNDKEAAKFQITEQDGDLLRTFELTPAMNQAGANTVTLQVRGPTALTYQVVSRHYEPWASQAEPVKPAFDVKVTYDRTNLTTTDELHATATLKYNGQQPAAMVMLELGIPPGFNVDAGEFAEMVAKKQVNKFSVTGRQVILYLSDVTPGQELKFTYPLKARFPVKAKTPETVAYEYYTPTNRGVAAPTELVVTESK